MQTANSIVIQAPEATIYDLAAAVEHWPALLPHYRRVRIVSGDRRQRLVEMAAQRDGIPVHWWAEQACFPEERRITFRHVRGVTAGMEVEWRLQPTSEGILVEIFHDLQLRWPLVGGLVADRIIGPFFVENIAGKTLRRIKLLAEAQQLGEPSASRAGTNDERLNNRDA